MHQLFVVVIDTPMKISLDICSNDGLLGLARLFSLIP